MKNIEEQGIPVRTMAFEKGRRFTRIYSKAVPVNDLEDVEALKAAMDYLIAEDSFIAVKERITRAIKRL